MKQIMKTGFLLLVVSAFLIGCGSKEIYNAGTYEGEGEGHHGMIKVAVRVDAKEIKSIDVIENPESEFAAQPIATIIDRAIKENSGDIDAVSGATDTSTGVIDAIKAALSEAKLD